MSARIDAISHQAMNLPPDQRMTLALALMESVEKEGDAGIAESWPSEIAARIERYDSGETASIPAQEVFRKLREIAPDR